MIRLPRELREILEASGVAWRLETGSRHFKLFVGARLVAILPKSPVSYRRSSRANRNTLADVRRVLRQVEQKGAGAGAV